MTLQSQKKSFGFIRGFLSVLSLSLVLVGCSPQKRALRALKRAERLYPAMFVQDTVYRPVVFDIPRKEVTFSTELPFTEPITISKDGVVVAMSPYPELDSINFSVIIEERDTVVDIPVEVKALDIPEEAYPDKVPWRLLIYTILFVTGAALLSTLLKSFQQ